MRFGLAVVVILTAIMPLQPQAEARPGAGPCVSFQNDARGESHGLSMRTPRGGFSQLGVPRSGAENHSVMMGRRR